MPLNSNAEVQVDDVIVLHGQFGAFLSLIAAFPSRIQPLSEALGDLYKEFDSLKRQLGDLTAKFEGVETFTDEIREGKVHIPPQRVQRQPPLPPRESSALRTAEGLRQWRRNRVLVQKIKRLPHA